MKSLLEMVLEDNTETVQQEVGSVKFLLFTYSEKVDTFTCRGCYTRKLMQLMSRNNIPLTHWSQFDDDDRGPLFFYYLDPADSRCVWVFVNKDETHRGVKPRIYLLREGNENNNNVVSEEVSTYTWFSAWWIMEQRVRLIGEIRRTDDRNDRHLVLLEGGKYHLLLEGYDGHNAVGGCALNDGGVLIHARMKVSPDKVSVFVLEAGATELKLKEQIRPEPGVRCMVEVSARS